jgi:DHA1 family multidrug resistance protein-like MFS transporter
VSAIVTKLIDEVDRGGLELTVYRRNFLLICVAQFCFALSMSVVDPVFPVYIASFGVSYALIGFVMSAFGLTRVFVEIPGGVLADRLGRRSLLLLGTGLALSSHIVAGLASSYLELVISRMIVGVGSAFSMTAGLMYVGEEAPPAQRPRNVARYQSMFSMGGIVGPTLGGILSDLLGIRLLFFIAGGLTLLGLVLNLQLRIPRPQRQTSARVPMRQISRMISNPLILILCAATFLTFFMFSSIRGTMIPLYGVDVLGLSTTQIGLVFSVTSATIVGILLGVIPALEQRFSRPHLLVISLGVATIAITALSLASDFLSLVLIAVPLGVGFSLIQPTPFVMILDLAAPDTRGLMMGLLRTTGDIGIIVGPILVGSLLDLGQPRLVFYVVATIFAFFTILSWSVFRRYTMSRFNDATTPRNHA